MNLTPIFLILSIYTCSAQQLEIKLTDLNFSASIFRYNKDSLSLFNPLQTSQSSNFQMIEKTPIYGNVLVYPEKKSYAFPEYNSIDKINNYKHLENKIDQDCIFCGALQGFLQK